jgi:hypothetical protein
MIFGYLILIVAVLISAIAAYYSVVGLTAIFAAAVVPVMIMGGALEAGKIVATVWLHNNWQRVGMAFKLYLIPAIIFLMLLTSMGIFGFLSKAHGDQSLVSGDAMARVAIYDEKIQISKDNIEANRKALKQMDEAVDQVMGRSSDEKGADKAVQIRRSQQKERVRLQSEIQAEQKTITALSQEAAPLRAEFRKVEAEVGPIKYIAALIYGDAASQNMLEAAVRWVIILIVIVFDPLALTLILAGNKQLEWARQGRGGWIHDEEDRPGPIERTVFEPKEKSPVQAPEPAEITEQEHPLSEEEREKKELEEVERFFWRGRMIAKALDAEEAERLTQEANEKLAEIDSAIDVDAMVEQAKTVSESEEQLAVKVREQQEFLDNLAQEFLQVEARVTETEQRRAELEAQLAQAEQVKSDLQIAINATTATNQDLTADKTQLAQDLITANNTAAKLRIQLTNSDTEVAQLKQYIESLQSDLQAAVALAQERNEKLNAALTQIPLPPPVLVEEVAEEIVVQMPDPEPPAPEQIIAGEETNYDPKLGYEQRYFSKYTAPVTDHNENADFGIEFPASPQKGDIFLRVDYLPSRLFKWNNSKWIEIDKTGNDRLAYNQAYIEHLIDSIRKGETDVDDLSQTEKDEIEQHLKRNDTTL